MAEITLEKLNAAFTLLKSKILNKDKQLDTRFASMGQYTQDKTRKIEIKLTKLVENQMEQIEELKKRVKELENRKPQEPTIVFRESKPRKIKSVFR